MRRVEATGCQGAVLYRLHRLATLSDADVAAVTRSMAFTRRAVARRDLVAERSPNGEARMLISGWAALSRIMMDGRRQILDLVLPGEIVGRRPLSGIASLTTVSAITDVEFGPVVDPVPDDADSGLARAYAVDNALHEHYLYRQIARIGRLNAYERMIDWFLELQERLELCGLCTANGFTFPVTQEMLADALGLTGVHVNRTLQVLRKDGILEVRDGHVRLPSIRELVDLVAYESAGTVLGLPGLRPSWETGDAGAPPLSAPARIWSA